MTIPTLKTPREACAAALAALVYGGTYADAKAILANARVDCTMEGQTAITARVKCGRSWHEATAGCRGDALAGALLDALGRDAAPCFDNPPEAVHGGGNS